MDICFRMHDRLSTNEMTGVIEDILNMPGVTFVSRLKRLRGTRDRRPRFCANVDNLQDAENVLSMLNEKLEIEWVQGEV